MRLEKAKLKDLQDMIGIMAIITKLNQLLKDNVNEDLEEQYNEMHPIGTQNANNLLQFLLRNQDKIDNRKYVLYNLHGSLQLLENWEENRRTVNIKKSKLIEAVNIMKSMLREEPNITICSLDDNDPFEIERVTLNDTLRRAEGKKAAKPKDERFDKIAENGLLHKAINVMYISDLRDCVTNPKKLGDYIGLVSIRKAL